MSIIITASHGFFSCCSCRLHEIIKYLNKNGCLPLSVDSTKQFGLYKIKGDPSDITFNYFKHYDSINLEYNFPVDYTQKYQYNDYSLLEYKKICPIVEKYFSPSDDIIQKKNMIQEKYNLDYENICVLFYRGNNKKRYTKICGYNEYIEIADKIFKKNPQIKFLIQSDESEFIEEIRHHYPKNNIVFWDEIRHIKKCDSSVDKVERKRNSLFSKYYLAITIIMSECKYIICGTGNCSIWIMLYRGHCKNVYQNRLGEWINSEC